MEQAQGRRRPTTRTANLSADIKQILADIIELRGDLAWTCTKRYSTNARINRLYDHLLRLQAKLNATSERLRR
jgi:hypothetical protein